MGRSVSLLLVTYNRPKLLQQILFAIDRFDWQYLDFVVVDNGSEEETHEILDGFKESLKLQVLALKENIGHGAGLAQGLEYLKTHTPSLEYVVFLEDDSIPQSPYLGFLIDKIDSEDFTLISSAGSNVKLGKRVKIKTNSKEVVQADFALFDGAIARFQDLVKIGFPVKDWFMMFDDFEYCYRIRGAGFKIGVVENPHLEILHEGWGGGTSHSHLWRSYYQARNFIHFVKIHTTAFTLLDCLLLQSKRLIGGFFTENGWKTTKMRLLGIKAGLKGKKGRSLNLQTLKED